MKKISLNGRWKFRGIDRYKRLPARNRRVLRWMDAIVPGNVHTDLMSLGIIGDPFYRMTETQVQWIEDLQWQYVHTFTVTKEFLREQRMWLLAEGLDTYATLRINGRKVGAAANMFIPHRFDVGKFLREGRNRIEILFDSPVMRSKILERRSGALHVALESHRVYVRKAQYSFGWDWGPKLTTSGIWKDISLEARSGGRLANPFVKILSLNRRSALVEVSVDVERYRGGPLRIGAVLAGEEWRLERDMDTVGKRVTFRTLIPNPKLWWPNGYGDQPMYRLLLTLSLGGVRLDEVEVPFAIRTVRLLQERDTGGRSFVFEINRKKIYCKGVDWIPADSFLPRVSDEKYEALLLRAKDAHMNMVRVWGGGVYERDQFYSLCDRLGLMVWQDFMFACGEYPDDRHFLHQVREEAGQVIRRLRNHSCIVIWCGNNECEWLYCTEHPDSGPDDMRGSRIFRDVLPHAARLLDGTRPYWRSSPFGSGFPNAESNGNHHQWIVWSYWKDYPEYENDTARFVTEFGFQAPANRRTFEEVMIASDRDPQSPVMEHHNKQTEGTERLIRFQSAHHRLSNSFDEFIHKGQLVQAEALRCAVEHWRRRKFSTAGALIWQLNDCWPVSSWSLVDSALRPKAAFFAAKRFFNPVLLSFKAEHSGIGCWMTNDHLVAIKGKILISLQSFDGAECWHRSRNVHLPPNRSVRCVLVPHRRFKYAAQRSVYLTGKFIANGAVASENRHFFSEPKHWEKPHGTLRSHVSECSPGIYRAELRSRTFLYGVRLEIEGEDAEFQDNYVDLNPGETKMILFASQLGLGQIRKRIRIRWL